jgi:hypothetical protein
MRMRRFIARSSPSADVTGGTPSSPEIVGEREHRRSRLFFLFFHEGVSRSQERYPVGESPGTDKPAMGVGDLFVLTDPSS